MPESGRPPVVARERQGIPTRRALVLASACVSWLLLVACQTGPWPQKAIQWVVAFPAGGGADAIARVIAPYLSRELGVPVNVVNRPGGNAVPAINYVMNSPPDGYVLLLEEQPVSATRVMLASDPIDIRNRTYGPLIVAAANAIVVNGQSPWNTLDEMVAFARRTPEEFTFWRTGGSFTEIIHNRFFELAGIDISRARPVDYRGGGPGNVAVAGGHVMMGGGGANAILNLVRSGDLKALAVTSSSRVTALPDVPTMAEAGYLEVDLNTWYGVSGPPGLPAEVMDRLDEVVRAVVGDTAFLEDMDELTAFEFHKSSVDARTHILGEAEYYRTLVQ